MKVFVVVATVKRLLVPELITDCKSVEVETPLTVEVRRVPEVTKPFDWIRLVVAVSPLIDVVRVLSVTD